MDSPQVLGREDYQIGVICALAIEQAAVIAALEGDKHPDLTPMSGDDNQYTFGSIKDHNIVITCLPAGYMGTANACNVATHMKRSFPIKCGLMIGIAGGVWSEENDVHLGDVVVSQPKGQFGGVVQYDFGKTERDGSFRRTSNLKEPPKVLLHSLQSLQTEHLSKGNNLMQILRAMFERKPHMSNDYGYPGAVFDQLFDASYDHEGGPTNCEGCDPSRVLQDWKPRDTPEPRIHYGTIASANQVMRHGPTRDRVAKDLGAIAFEMEAAGLMNHFPCLVIRGICDYADTHKNKRWQGYAAATAAAFAKELIGFIPKQEVVKLQLAFKNEHWIVPRGSSALFTGRASVIQEVEQQLCTPRTQLQDKQRRFVLVGMGGIGKSEICLKVAETLRERFWGVFWVDVSSNTNAERGFVEIGKTCNIPEPKLDGVKKWLAATEHSWLLVLDNADDRDADYAQYFPSGNRGSIILTTRNPQCRIHNNVGYRDLEALDPKDAIVLLLKAVCVEPDLWESFKTAAAAVINVLGSHTLAIVQAGAFIQQGLCSLEEYPNHFIQQRQRLLQFRPMQANSVYGDVYATFEVSAKHLEDSARPSAKIALRLLRLLAFLHFDDVPISIIVERAWENAKAIAAEGPETNSDHPLELTMWHVSRVFSLMQTSGDERKGSSTTSPERISPKKRRTDKLTFHDDDVDTILLNEARAYLASFSIVRVNFTSCTLTMHPLAHAWANDRLEASEREEARVAAGCILALSVWDWKYELVWLQLQPHLESYLHHWPLESSLISIEAVPFLYLLARRLGPLWSLTEAERILLLLVEHESVKIKPNIDIWVSVSLASCYDQAGKVGEAETLLQEKLHTYQSTFGPTHKGMLQLQHRLGEIYFRSGKSHKGILILETVVKIQQSTYEADTTGRLNAEQTLGVAYVQIGEFGKGIQLLERVVEIEKTTLQTEDPDRLHTLRSLADAYLRIGQATKGITILEEVVETQKRLLGEKSRDHLVSQQTLGQAYCNIGETMEGIQLLEKVVKIQGNMLQTDDRYRLISLYHLGAAYLKIGQVKEAITLLKEVVKIRKVTLKPEDPNRLCSLHQLARAYLKIGRVEEAITAFEEVVEIRKVTLKPEDPNRLCSLYELARAYLKIGRVEEAITLLEEVVHFDQMMLKPEDPNRQRSEKLLAEALRRREEDQRDTSVA